MYEFIALLIEVAVYAWPTKKNRALWRKFRLLRKEDWYRKLQNQHLKGFHLNDSARKYIEQWDIEEMVHNPEMVETFRIGLRDILKRESF